MQFFGLFEIQFKWIYIKRQIKKLVRQGEIIGAIKLYRQKTGKGLKESKDYVFSIREKLGLMSK